MPVYKIPSVKNREPHEDPEVMLQGAPWPAELAALVRGLELTTRPGWKVDLDNVDRGQGSKGLTLTVLIGGPDSYRPDLTIRVAHYFPVPPAAYDARSWRRWLFDRLADVDTHELCEGFTIGGAKPYAPSHGPGNDPYMVRELGTQADQEMRFTGEPSGSPARMPGAVPPVISTRLAVELAALVGQWVAVDDGRIRASGTEAGPVADEAEALGLTPGSYLLFRVPETFAGAGKAAG